MFADVVMELSKKTFEVIIDELKEKKGVKDDIDLGVDDMKELVRLFKEYYKREKGEDFPSDPRVQLMAAVKAVFRSWDNPRANVYRRMNDIPYSWGTAVNVQPMVFGNLNTNSGTGVAFSRDPATVRTLSSASISSTLRARTLLQVSVLPARLHSLRKICPKSMKSS
jgi:pyruvate,orthophosphate dikinase